MGRRRVALKKQSNINGFLPCGGVGAGSPLARRRRVQKPVDNSVGEVLAGPPAVRAQDVSGTWCAAAGAGWRRAAHGGSGRSETGIAAAQPAPWLIARGGGCGRRGARPLALRSAQKSRRPVSRVLSLPCGNGQPFICDARYRAPDATNPDGRAEMPPAAPCGLPATPIRSCSRWGLPCHPCCQGCGALLPHRFTLTLTPGYPDGQAVCFLWHFPWGRPRRPLTGTVSPWSPDFPPAVARQRLPGRLDGTVQAPGVSLVKRHAGGRPLHQTWRAECQFRLT